MSDDEDQKITSLNVPVNGGANVESSKRTTIIYNESDEDQDELRSSHKECQEQAPRTTMEK